MRATIVVILFVAAGAVFVMPALRGPGGPAYADEVDGEELSFYMDHMRRLTHKLGLSIDAKNGALASFYMEEIGEMAELIKARFPEYDGFQIGALITAMLNPYLTPLGKAVEGGDWGAADSAYDILLTGGCNGCHTATQHAFVKIVRSKTNPYNQDFAP